MARAVLIVDDSRMDRVLLSEILKSEYEILEAVDGQEALLTFQANSDKLSAMILDLSMPRMDGYTVLREIRSNPDFFQIPIVVATGIDDEKSREKAIGLGADGFITKPYNSYLLQNCLRNAISLRENAALANTLSKDRLTGLLNRDAFYREADLMLAQREPGYYVLSCFDIDNFKVINDQYGMRVGDEVLRHVADCLGKCVTELGGIACRFSADRFAILYPEEFMDSQKISENHKLVTSPSCLGRKIRIRIGRFRANDLSIHASTMFEWATMAEESIKGRYDTYIAEYNDSMRAKLLHEQQIVNDMGSALAAGQFQPWFQPQFNHATGAMIGAEALVRWKRDDSFVSPSEFIPVFERNGFIYDMDKSIWEQVCVFLRRWLDEGRSPLPISVNISRFDICQGDFLETLCGLVSRYAIPADLLRLEVTESAFADSTNQIIHVVNRLIDRGFTLEIDDFGSGYSSLNTLKDVPASILKLDMKFFENTANTQRGGNIVESVVRMAKWLGMAVIAEGVEDWTQADFLKSIGCHYIQGYCYAKAMPPAEYETLCAGMKKEPKLAGLKTLENLNNNEFWNPKSLETLIFNSYVGGACIFEYHHGATELLRVNDRFAQELGLLMPRGAPLSELCPVRFLSDEERGRLLQNLRRAIDTSKESSCELKFSDSSQSPAVVEYIRTTVRSIAQTDDRYLFYCVIVNMTEQRLAEQKRLEAEKKELESAQRLKVIMGNVNGGVSAILIDDDGKSTSVFNSDKYYELYGYTKKQARAAHLDVMTLIVPEDLPLVMKKVKTLKRNRKPTIIDYRCIRQDGRIIYLRANSSIMRMEGFGDDVITSVVTDITEKRELEGQLRAVVDNINGGVTATVLKAGKPHFIVVNDQYFRMLGYTREQYEAECPDKYALIHPDDRDRVVRQFESSDGGKKQYTMEYRVLRRDGEVRYIQNNISVIRIFGVDEPVQFSVANDITELRLAQQKEHMTSVQLQSIMSNIHNGITATVFHSKDNVEIIFSNDYFYKMYGYTREQLETELDNLLDLIYPEDRDKTMETVARIVRERGSETYEYRCRCRDGSMVWIQVSNSVIALDGVGDTVLLAITQDITEQKRARNQQIELLDNLPCGAALYQYDGKRLSVVHINKRYWELVERERVDYSNISIMGMVFPDDRAIVKQELETAIRQKRGLTLEIRIMCANGEYHPFHIAANITPLSNGKYLLFTSYTPISEEVMSVQKMLPIALSGMMSASGDLSFVKNRDLHYICCSHSSAEFLGLVSERDIAGKTDQELFGAALAEKFTADDRRVLETGQPVLDRIEKMRAKDGRELLMSASKYPLWDTSGHVAGLYGVSRDITAQQEAESQLKLLTNTIPGGIATFRCAPGRLHIAYYNDGLCNLFGYTREEYVQLKIHPMDLVFAEDKPIIYEQLDQLLNGRPRADCTYRIHKKDGGYKWANCRAVLVDRIGEEAIVNAVLTDITEQQEEREQLSLREEEYRLATQHSKRTICRYSIADQTLKITSEAAQRLSLPEVLTGVPYELVKLGKISPDTTKAYLAFYEGIMRGETEKTVTYQKLLPKGWRWINARATTIVSRNGKPLSAIISYLDVTEQQEKEVVFKKWQQNLLNRPLESYTLFCVNLNKNDSYDSKRGTLLDFSGGTEGMSFHDRTQEFAEQFVAEEDREPYLKLVNADAMLASYCRGKRTAQLEFRGRLADGVTRWLRLSVELVEYPNSTDVEAYLMYEDIDDAKKEELAIKKRSETDVLTGVLNRAAFASRLKEIVENSAPGKNHALFMLDIDNFKKINDTFGHGTGDLTLKLLTQKVRSLLRRDDLLGRLGGDEFLMFLRDIPDAEVASARAEDICALDLRVPDSDYRISSSIGIVMVPQDGRDFESLYKKADTALYREKKRGKGGFQFYSE